MGLQSAFRDRLGDMESTRNQRLSLLQDEKELQRSKSLLLSAKHAKIRLLEQRCLMLDHKLASDHFKISSLKSEIEFLDSKYHTSAQQLRDLKVELEELEQLEMERDKVYALKCSEMNDFKNRIQESADEIICNLQELRSSRDKLKLFHLRVQENNMAQNRDIQAAEMRKSELLAFNQKVTSCLESNKRQKLSLQQQLQSLR